MAFNPSRPVKKILLIKSYSMGIGDLLRSSAAWRALKDRWPDVELHLLFLSKHAGYAVEELIKQHPLLTSASFLTVREQDPAIAGAKRVPMQVLIKQVQDICRSIEPDLIIDFESAGIRSSLITHQAARVCSATTVGIGQFPGRGLFYNLVAPSAKKYIHRHQLDDRMDYTNRDFIALAALGIERESRPIELALTKEGAVFAQQLISRIPNHLPAIGLNIGCGTADALHKRPEMSVLVESMGALQQKHPHSLLLSGAKFEKDVNELFIATYAKRWGDTSHIYDLAGETSLGSLTGLINACQVFISTDSGPYHMAVAMKKPTLVLFTYAETTSFHGHTWCERLIQPFSPAEFLDALSRLYIKS